MKLEYDLINTNIKPKLNFKSVCAAYKVHYKVYRSTTVYTDETADVNDGTNVFTISGSTSQARYLDIKFFDKDGNQFYPYNVEFMTNLKPTNGGNGIEIILSDGTIRIIVQNNVYTDSGKHQHAIQFVWDSVNEEIDNRKVTIAFDFE